MHVKIRVETISNITANTLTSINSAQPSSPHQSAIRPTPRYHPTQHQHPHQKHRADDPKRKHRLPLLANTPLLQPGQSIEIQRVLGVVEDIRLAVPVDVTFGPEELYGRLDDAGDVEDEQDEGAKHYDAR